MDTSWCILNVYSLVRNCLTFASNSVQPRSRGKLIRRIYSNPGPDFLWHIDSYDKLIPYGICINGCIYGYLRYIIWLEVFKTNSDPLSLQSLHLIWYINRSSYLFERFTNSSEQILYYLASLRYRNNLYISAYFYRAILLQGTAIRCAQKYMISFLSCLNVLF